MFKVGDRVVYPMHGAGIIEKIEKKSILETEREYYVIKIPYEKMSAGIPVDNSEAVGIREVVSEETMKEAFVKLGEPVTEMDSNWNRRHRENTAKLRTGDIFAVVDVVRNLMHAEHIKGLSSGEKKLLMNAKHILISEIVLVNNIGIEDAETLVENAVFGK